MTRARLMAARTLAELRAHPVLILAAIDGRIARVECAMPNCLCPEGRGYFYRKGSIRFGHWAPSPDRWPVAGRDGGTYEPDNVRLAHWHCNHVDGGEAAGRARAALNGTPRGDAANAQMARTQRLRTEGRAEQGRRHAEWLRSPDGREAVERWARAGVESPARAEWNRSADGRAAKISGACARWYINRGRPCMCGRHLGASTSVGYEPTTIASTLQNAAGR